MVLELAHCLGALSPDPTSGAVSEQVPLGQSPSGVREAGQALELLSLPLLVSFHQDEQLLQAQSERQKNIYKCCKPGSKVLAEFASGTMLLSR